MGANASVLTTEREDYTLAGRPSGDESFSASLPRVAVRTRQPWAVRRMPVGQRSDMCQFAAESGN